MQRQILNIGTAANDKTGDTLRIGGQKINENFAALWDILGDSDNLSSTVKFVNNGVEFDGESINSFKTLLIAEDPTSNNVVTIPNGNGTLITTDAQVTLTNKTLTLPNLITPVLKDLSEDNNITIVPVEFTEDVILTIPSFTDSDSIVLLNTQQTLSNKNITLSTLVSPLIQDNIKDINSNTIIDVIATSSAVNNISVKNSITNQDPEISVTGVDSDINLVLKAKGTGAVTLERYAYESEIITGSGALGFNAPLTRFSNGSALAITMADGTVQGQRKDLINEGTGTVTITVTNLAGGSQIILNQNDYKSVIWSGTRWYLRT